MSTQTLRALAKDYARGAINKEKYRKSRADLIQGIIAGNIPVKVINYAPPLDLPDDEEITETAQREKRDASKTELRPEQPAAKKTPSAPAPTPKPQPRPVAEEKKSPILFVTVSACVVILLVIAVILFYPKPPGATKEQTVATDDSSVPEQTGESGNMAGETLLADFLKERNWSEDSLDSFISSWSSLTNEERNTASQTKRMQRMNDSIYKQFLEEKALASIDSEKAIMKQQKLIEFAEAIGISDSRLVLD